MSELLLDMLNLQILENLCIGTGVEVNISALSKTLKKHRKTIRSQVNGLFDAEIINKPVYPFTWLFQEYPLLVTARADLPMNEEINQFLIEDDHIFGVFYVGDEEYNTLLIEFHKDITSYSKWRRRIVVENKIPSRNNRYPANSLFFSNNLILKYQPFSPIHNMEMHYRENKPLEINGYRLNYLGFQILKKLLMGEGIRTNENMLSKKLNVNRKTIERRISSLLKEKIVSAPACRFPKFFVPPNQILIYNLMEIKKSQDEFVKAIKNDPSVPIAIEANIGRYTLLLFQVFSKVEEYFEWERKYNIQFPQCIGGMKKIFLSPMMTASIDQQKVSLGIIEKKKEYVRGKYLIESIGNTL